MSNDVAKGDWTLEVHGLRIGPRPELVREMREAAAAGLHWMTTSEFLAEAARASLSEVSAGTLEEASISTRLASVVRAIRGFVRDADGPVVSSAVANAALGADPTLVDTAWSGTGTFRRFLDENVPELRFVIPPKPGYVMDPERHSVDDIEKRREWSARATAQPDGDPLPHAVGAAELLSPTVRRQLEEAMSPAVQEQLRALLSPDVQNQLRQVLSPEVQAQIRRLRDLS